MGVRKAGDPFDSSLIDEMLALSPAARIERHDQALELVLMLERAGRKLRDREPGPDSPAPPGTS
jgi:hypothetical protein